MRGIMMIEPLYNQTLRGNKNQTRRDGGLDAVNGNKKKGILTNPDDWQIAACGVSLITPKHAMEDILRLTGGKPQKYRHLVYVNFGNITTNEVVKCKPVYKYNDIVYLKEPWAWAGDTNQIIYKFGYPANVPTHFENVPTVDKIQWKNKMFMAEDKAREYIRITGVRIARLHDISEDDSILEGVEYMQLKKQRLYKDYLSKDGWGTFKTAKESFFSLFKFANKVKQVENIWVWVYTYEHLKYYKNEIH